MGRYMQGMSRGSYQCPIRFEINYNNGLSYANALSSPQVRHQCGSLESAIIINERLFGLRTNQILAISFAWLCLKYIQIQLFCVHLHIRGVLLMTMYSQYICFKQILTYHSISKLVSSSLCKSIIILGGRLFCMIIPKYSSTSSMVCQIL